MQSKSKIDGSVWQLLKKSGDAYTAVDGYKEVKDCTSGDCATSTDKDATAGGFRLDGLTAGEYQLKETTVPTGYVDTDEVKARTYDFVIPDSTSQTATPDTNNVTLIDGVYVVLLKDGSTSKFDAASKTNVVGNDRKTGSVVWNKVSAEDADKKLSGSEWPRCRTTRLRPAPSNGSSLPARHCPPPSPIAPHKDAGEPTRMPTVERSSCRDSAGEPTV